MQSDMSSQNRSQQKYELLMPIAASSHRFCYVDRRKCQALSPGQRSRCALHVAATSARCIHHTALAPAKTLTLYSILSTLSGRCIERYVLSVVGRIRSTCCPLGQPDHLDLYPWRLRRRKHHSFGISARPSVDNDLHRRNRRLSRSVSSGELDSGECMRSGGGDGACG